MPNTFSVTNWITMEVLRILENKLEVAQFFNTDFNSELTKEFPVGTTFNVKLPARFIGRTGMGYTPENLVPPTTPVTCDHVAGVDFEWDSFEAALLLERSEDELRRRYLSPAAATLKQLIDSAAAQYAMLNSNNITGALGTNPATFAATSSAARQRMMELAGWSDGEKGCLLPPVVVGLVKAASLALFNPSSDISRQYKEGSIGKADGFDWYESMSLFQHTAGTIAGAVTVVALGGVGGTQLTVTATAGDTFFVGDVYSILNVFPVNPMTRRATNATTTFQFTITQPLVAAGGGVDVLTIKPGIRGPGDQYQNVDALPVAGAALTLFPGTGAPSGNVGHNGLALGPNAFALVSVKFQNPKAVEIASQTRNPDTGVSVAFVRAFNIQGRTMANRFDVCYGFGDLYPNEESVRILCA
jgi:hypothetical protein